MSGIGKNVEDTQGNGVESQRHPPSSGRDPARETLLPRQSRSIFYDSIQSEGPNYPDEHDQTAELYYDTLVLDQTQVFLEDAIYYRSIHHKVDIYSLRLYRLYYSTHFQWFLNGVILFLHVLAFVEEPSSLTLTSDIRVKVERWTPPCGLTESLELLSLMILLFDSLIKSYLMGWRRVRKSQWIMGCYAVLVFSFVDMIVTASLGCHEVIKVRRFLRPYFIVQKSSMMKKTVRGLKRTIPEVGSILLLLLLHLYFFTLLGMLLFPEPKRNAGDESAYFRTFVDSLVGMLVLLTTANNPDFMMEAYSKNRFYAIFFVVYLGVGLYCFMNMLTAVIFNQFRGYFQNSMQSSFFRRRVATRAAYEVLRCRQRMSVWPRPAAGGGQAQSCEGVTPHSVRAVISRLRILSDKARSRLLSRLSVFEGDRLNAEEFTRFFDLLDRAETSSTKPSPPSYEDRPRLQTLQRLVFHPLFHYFSSLIIVGNVVCITVELSLDYDLSIDSNHSALRIINTLFTVYYVIEKVILIVASGVPLIWKRWSEVMDIIVLLAIVVLEIALTCSYGANIIPDPTTRKLEDVDLGFWEYIKAINILIVIRLVRVIPQIKSMSLVLFTVVDVARHLTPFAGILVVIYYFFAILGVELFRGKTEILLSTSNISVYVCGSYEQLDYWANNFNDFGAALVVLWDIMIVNNWHIFLDAYSRVTNSWAKLYFIAWWLVSVIVSVNLFTALIIENFIMRWDRKQHEADETDSDRTVGRNRSESTGSTWMTSQRHSESNPLSLHDLFRDRLQEPSEEDIRSELLTHKFMKFDPSS